MKYQTKTVSWLDTPLPNWTLGMDRLDWVSPLPGQNERNLDQIANGNLSRFVEYDDRLEITETRKILYTTWTNLAAAQSAAQWVQTYGVPEWSESIEVIERPDL